MKVKRITGINAFCAKGTMDEVVKLFQALLGAKIGPEMPWRAKFGTRNRGAWLGEEDPFRVEISESINDELPAGKQHKRYGTCFQAIGLEVDNIDEAIAELRGKGYTVSKKIPTEDPAFANMYQAWIHPKESFGLIIELIQFGEKTPPDGTW